MTFYHPRFDLSTVKTRKNDLASHQHNKLDLLAAIENDTVSFELIRSLTGLESEQYSAKDGTGQWRPQRYESFLQRFTFDTTIYLNAKFTSPLVLAKWIVGMSVSKAERRTIVPSLLITVVDGIADLHDLEEKGYKVIEHEYYAGIDDLSEEQKLGLIDDGFDITDLQRAITHVVYQPV